MVKKTSSEKETISRIELLYHHHHHVDHVDEVYIHYVEVCVCVCHEK